jgi:hypothetical protein
MRHGHYVYTIVLEAIHHAVWKPIYEDETMAIVVVRKGLRRFNDTVEGSLNFGFKPN